MENYDREKFKPHKFHLGNVIKCNITRIKMVDWQNDDFLNHIPEDCALFTEKDNKVMNNILSEHGNNINCFHQIGCLEQYLVRKDKNDPNESAKKYLNIPHITYAFAFECGNVCQNIWTKEGRNATVKNRQYVIESVVLVEDIVNYLMTFAESDQCIDVIKNREEMPSLEDVGSFNNKI